MDNNYDLVFHLVGKQQIPNLLGIQNITSKKHIFIHTKEYNKTYCQQLLNLDYKFDTILVDAYNINNIKENIEKYLQNNQNKKIAFNLTSGTKIMGFAVYDICNKYNSDAYYFDTQNRKLLCINKSVMYDIKTIDKLDTFLDLGKEIYSICDKGRSNISDKHKSMARLLFKYSNDTKKVIEKYKSINKNNSSDSFLSGAYNHINILEYKNRMNYKIKIENVICEYKDIDFIQYMNGLWFEEYIFTIVDEYRKKHKHKNIYDLRTGIKLISQKSNDFFHELDVVFTDGLNLYIIECKSGNTKHDHIEKIHSVTEQCGGLYAKPIFISIQMNKSIFLRYGEKNYFFGKDIENKLVKYLDKITNINNAYNA